MNNIHLIPWDSLKSDNNSFVVQGDYFAGFDGKVNFNKVEKGVF